MTQPLTEEKIEKLLQELQSEDARRRKMWVEEIGNLKESDGRIAYALEDMAASDSNEQVRRAARKALLAPAHQPFTYIRKSLPVATSTGKRPIGPEERTARNWYRWLWLSPLVTVPTFMLISVSNPGYELICGGIWNGCDYWGLARTVTDLIAVSSSALWHLILLFPALNKESKFVRWHGGQMLLLAGLRTVVPLAFVGFGMRFRLFDDRIFLFILIQIVVWLSGTLWGQNQAVRGDCSLMRWFGRAEALPSRTRDTEPAKAKQRDREDLIEIIRYSQDPVERNRALLKLEQLGLVRSL